MSEADPLVATAARPKEVLAAVASAEPRRVRPNTPEVTPANVVKFALKGCAQAVSLCVNLRGVIIRASSVPVVVSACVAISAIPLTDSDASAGEPELPALTSLIAATTEVLSVVVRPDRVPVPEPVIMVLMVLNSVATLVAKLLTFVAKDIRSIHSQTVKTNWLYHHRLGVELPKTNDFESQLLKNNHQVILLAQLDPRLQD
jgi:hypothetical protein